MARFLGLAVFALAIAASFSYPVEELPKEAVSSEKGPVPVPDAKPDLEPEVHEPVPADQSLPKSSELPQDEPVKEAPLPVEESPKKDELVSFESFDADKSGYIEPAEWQLKAEEGKKDKFSQVDVNGDSRISPEEFRGLAIPAEPQEAVGEERAPAEVSSQPKEDKPVEAPADEAAAPVGRSTEADKVAPVDGEKPSLVVVDPVPKEPVVAESSKTDVIAEPVPAVSVQVSDEENSPKSSGVSSEDNFAYPGAKVEGDGFKPESDIAKPVVPEIRSDSVAEDIDDQVSEQKDPVLSDEVKSEEVKSEEVKSEEVKSDEVKSGEVKSDETRSEASRSEEPKQELPKLEESKSEEVKSEVSKSEEVKSEDLKPLEDKPQDVLKPVDLRSEEAKEDLKPEVAKAPVEEADKPKEEDKVKEEVKVVEPVQSDEPAKVSEEVKKVEVAKDSSLFSKVRV